MHLGVTTYISHGDRALRIQIFTITTNDQPHTATEPRELEFLTSGTTSSCQRCRRSEIYKPNLVAVSGLHKAPT